MVYGTQITILFLGFKNHSYKFHKPYNVAPPSYKLVCKPQYITLLKPTYITGGAHLVGTIHGQFFRELPGEYLWSMAKTRTEPIEDRGSYHYTMGNCLKIGYLDGP